MEGLANLNTDRFSAAADIVSHMLSSTETQAVWEKYHHSRQHDSPALQASHRLRNMKAPTHNDAALLSFAKALVGLERDALGNNPAKDSKEITGLKRDLNILHNYLSQSLPEENTLDDGLPENYKLLLDALQRQTQQKKLRPLKALRHTAEHLWEDNKNTARQYPVAFGSFFTLSVSLLAFLNMKMGATTSYIDPRATGLTAFEFDDDGKLIEFSVDPALIDYNAARSCHDHIAQISPALADWLKEAELTLPQHCSKLKTMAIDAQDALKTGYGFIKTPYDIFVQNPVESIGDLALQNSHYMMAFNAAAHNVSEFVYQANMVENLTLHPIMSGIGFLAAIRCANLNTKERKELTDSIGDFLHRARHNYLPGAFAVAASGATYMAQSGPSTNMVWAFLAGGLTGHVIKKVIDRSKRKDHVLKITGDARTLLSEFTKTAEDTASESPPEKTRLKNLGAKISAGVISLSAYATLVFADTAGYIDKLADGPLKDCLIHSSEIAGNITAAALVLGAFLPYNVLEDAAQHGFFSTAGMAAAFPFILLSLRARQKITPSAPGLTNDL